MNLSYLGACSKERVGITGSIPVPASTLFPFSLGCVSHETHQKALKGARKRLLTLKFNFICRWSRRMLATYGET
jgi:hypothetical protein